MNVRNKNNVFSLVRGRGPIKGEDIEALVSKSIFRSTSCGAWIKFNEDGVSMGSIVEGTDATTPIQTLTYPFPEKAFWDALNQVEYDAEDIWHDTHGCEECNLDGAINPKCKNCQGEGIIL